MKVGESDARPTFQSSLQSDASKQACFFLCFERLAPKRLVHWMSPWSAHASHVHMQAVSWGSDLESALTSPWPPKVPKYRAVESLNTLNRNMDLRYRRHKAPHWQTGSESQGDYRSAP